MSPARCEDDDCHVTGQISAPRHLLRHGATRVVIAGLLVLSLITGAWRVIWAQGDVRGADVVLSEAVDVTVVLGGVSRPGVVGESVPRGAVVATGPAGAATLDVRDRLVRLGIDTTVDVPDGATLQIRRGRILVDRRRGPGITVLAGPLVVDEIARGGLRVDRGFSTRVTVYSGGARVGIADRRLDVPRLHLVSVAGRALSDRPTPLRLTGDAWEREIVPDVVSADVTLSRLARGIDAAAEPAGHPTVLPAAYRAALVALPPDAGRSEALLPVAIGRAAGGTDRIINRAQQLRSDGASWGVVAALVGARSAEVAAELASLISRTTRPAEGPVAGPAPDGDVAAPTSAPSAQPQPSSSARPSPGTPSRPSGSPSPSPSPSPSEGLVDTIRRLLPSGSPTPPAVVPTLFGLPSDVLSAVG